MTTRNRKTTTLLGPLLFLCATAWSSAAHAGDRREVPRIALLPFDGREAAVPPKRPLSPEAASKAVQALLASRADGRYEVLPSSRWVGVARRHFRGRSNEIQAIAKYLRCELVIGGWIEARPADEGGKPFALTVALYNNWAEPLGQLRFEQNEQRPNLDGLAAMAGPLFQMIEHALGFTPPRRPQERYARVVQADDKELAPLPRQQPVSGTGADSPLVPPTPEARALYHERPPWRPFIDLQVGYLYNIRHFTDGGSGREFHTSGAHGLRVHAELYPFALARRFSLALAGLGVRFTGLLPFWPDVQIVNERGQQVGLYQATERRFEGALRWHYNIFDAVLRPEIELEALYGHHLFSFSIKENALVLDIPTAAYSYLGGAAGLRMHLGRRFAVRLGATFAALLDLGPMGQPGAPGDDPRQASPPRDHHVYGPGGGWLWRGDLALSLRVVKGFSLGIGGYFEQKRLSFDGTGDVLLRDQSGAPTPERVREATDEFGGVFLTAGFVY